MFNFLNAWYRRYFTDPQAALLAVLLLVSFVTVFFMGTMLAPLLAAVVIAYLLEVPVSKFEHRRAPRLLAVNIVFLVFASFMGFIVVVILPIL